MKRKGFIEIVIILICAIILLLIQKGAFSLNKEKINLKFGLGLRGSVFTPLRGDFEGTLNLYNFYQTRVERLKIYALESIHFIGSDLNAQNQFKLGFGIESGIMLNNSFLFGFFGKFETFKEIELGLNLSGFILKEENLQINIGVKPAYYLSDFLNNKKDYFKLNFFIDFLIL